MFQEILDTLNNIIGDSFINKAIAIAIAVFSGFLIFKFIKTSVKMFLYLFVILIVVGIILVVYKNII